MHTATLHLLGPGMVGCSMLRQLTGLPVLLVAVSDSRGTVHDARGLDPVAVVAHRRAGRSVVELPNGFAAPTVDAVRRVQADFVVDATPTDPRGTEAAVARGDAALDHGAFLALCAKNALAAACGRWLQPPPRSRLGINASLGGSGRQFLRELDSLRADCTGLALVGNVTTTVVLQAVESGASVAEGIEVARRRGLLEPDPTLDLDGSDAATKLCAVWNALFSGPTAPRAGPETVERQDIRGVDVHAVRERVARGATTRLVARGGRGGRLRVGFEELPAASPLAAPPDRVVYGYERPSGLHVHHGTALGHDRTAAALLVDVRAALGLPVP